MKISELIKKLEEIKKEEGDLELISKIWNEHKEKVEYKIIKYPYFIYADYLRLEKEKLPNSYLIVETQ